MKSPSNGPLKPRLRDPHPFLIIEENRFAYAAAMQLRTGEPTKPCRLVTISGPSGVGKSHLCRQLLREASEVEPKLIDLHTTAANFAAEFASASEGKCIPEFQMTYRRARLLVVEDIQSLSDRHETQQQLLATIDEVISSGGRVLMTANLAAGEIPNLSSRLVNRCHGGVCADIALPDHGSRCTLLAHFCNSLQLPISEETVRLLAKKLIVSPRELHGALVKIRTLMSSTSRAPEHTLAQLVIDELAASAVPSISEISRVVSNEFGVSVTEMRSPGRFQGTVLARQTAMYLARKCASAPFKEIGNYFGGRNHATAIHACNRAQEQLAEDTNYARQVHAILQSLKGGGHRLCGQTIESLSADDE